MFIDLCRPSGPDRRRGAPGRSVSAEVSRRVGEDGQRPVCRRVRSTLHVFQSPSPPPRFPPPVTETGIGPGDYWGHGALRVHLLGLTVPSRSS